MSTREELEQTNLSAFKITFLFSRKRKLVSKKKTKGKGQKTKATYENSFPYEKEESENSYLNRKTQRTSEQYVPTRFE